MLIERLENEKKELAADLRLAQQQMGSKGEQVRRKEAACCVVAIIREQPVELVLLEVSCCIFIRRELPSVVL